MFGSQRRVVGIALAALVAALVLAACGGGGDDGTTVATGEGGDQFTSDAFAKTLAAVKADKGDDAELLEIQITQGGTDYQIRDGEKATGLHFAPGSDEGEAVDVQIVGTGSVADSAYPLSTVDPAAIDKMVAAAPAASGTDDFKVTVMTLGKQFSTQLQWTINGEAAGRTGLVLNANPNGENLTSPTGAVPGGTTTGTGTTGGAAPAAPGPNTAAPGAGDAQAVAQCIQDAGTDAAKIQACLKQ